MKKRLTLVSILSFVLLSIGLFIYINYNINTSKATQNKKEYITDKNLKNSIDELLDKFFKLDDSKLSKQEFITNYYEQANKLIDCTDDTLLFVYVDKFTKNLKNNYEKQNINTDININNIYKLNINEFEVNFIVKKEFNTKQNSNLITSKKIYNAVITIKQGNVAILKLYNVNDFENYINKKHKILKNFMSKEKLYYKYLNYNFKKFQERQQLTI